MGAGALFALSLLSSNKSGGNCSVKYDVPGQYSGTGQTIKVCESDLWKYGFFKYEGDYYHSSQFPPTGAGSGEGIDWQQWGQLLQQGVNAGLSVYNAVNTVVDQFTPNIQVQPNWALGTVTYLFDLPFKQVQGVAELDDWQTDFTINPGWEIDTPSPGIMTFTIYKNEQPIKQKTVNFQLQQVYD